MAVQALSARFLRIDRYLRICYYIVDKSFDGKQVGARTPERELPDGERRGAKRFEYIS